MNKQQGFILLAVLLWTQVLALLGLGALEQVFLEQKLLSDQQSHRLLLNEAERRLRRLAASIQNLSAFCHQTPTSPMQLRSRSLAWWVDHSCIDKHKGFYVSKIAPDCRALMNVVFSLAREELTEDFLTQATQAGLANLRGHRAAGGCRASIYNAMPEAGIDCLVEFMTEFAKKNG